MMRLRTEWQLAVAVPRWAWRFYRRHWAIIVGLSLIPSIQRLIVVGWGEHIPSSAAVASEVLVVVVRLALLVTIWRLAAVGKPRWAFVTTHWRGLVLQGGLLLLATLIFKFGLDSVGGLLPEPARQPYLAGLLFIKNPTIIAFTVVWVVGVVRQLAGSSEVVVGE
jgi:hypothetical protein